MSKNDLVKFLYVWQVSILASRNQSPRQKNFSPEAHHKELQEAEDSINLREKTIEAKPFVLCDHVMSNRLSASCETFDSFCFTVHVRGQPFYYKRIHGPVVRRIIFHEIHEIQAELVFGSSLITLKRPFWWTSARRTRVSNEIMSCKRPRFRSGLLLRYLISIGINACFRSKWCSAYPS